mmetsp:Transcript_3249/g.5337  ORF Transcript_3249/g.5337 Transcript_3249/m.5337 type:complete len:120 (-) Transcript_3249:134-493(-)
MAFVAYSGFEGTHETVRQISGTKYDKDDQDISDTDTTVGAFSTFGSWFSTQKDGDDELDGFWRCEAERRMQSDKPLSLSIYDMMAAFLSVFVPPQSDTTCGFYESRGRVPVDNMLPLSW